MKKNTLLAFGWIAAVSLSTSVYAAPAGSQPAAGPHPCKEIMEACKSAGFVKGGGPGKAIMKDCMKPLMAGATVNGVTVTPEQLSACKAKMAASGR